MSTAIDPLTGIYRSGLMWFDQRNGIATRGFDQVEGIKTIGSATFQKGGGLGGVALLAVAAPVEIGNRVWLDADLNGRQDADEPAINGAVVELWTADDNGEPDELVATRTTSTINGQPGTYYFRTDDPDVAGADGAPAFVDNTSYVLVFKPGSTLTLAGPNADHAGFAGLTWGDLQLTDAEVRVTPTAANGGTTEVNDSNPDPDDGRVRALRRRTGPEQPHLRRRLVRRGALRGAQDGHRSRPRRTSPTTSRSRRRSTSAGRTV